MLGVTNIGAVTFGVPLCSLTGSAGVAWYWGWGDYIFSLGGRSTELPPTVMVHVVWRQHHEAHEDECKVWHGGFFGLWSRWALSLGHPGRQSFL